MTMKINLIVIKTMKLFLSLLLFLLICFGIWIFLVISIEVAKIYFVMKYLKYPCLLYTSDAADE